MNRRIDHFLRAYEHVFDEVITEIRSGKKTRKVV